MARVTVEDCLESVDNRFELVLVASKRARHLAMQSVDLLVEDENDKETVNALREIAAGHIQQDYLDKELSELAVSNENADNTNNADAENTTGGHDGSASE